MKVLEGLLPGLQVTISWCPQVAESMRECLQVLLWDTGTMHDDFVLMPLSLPRDPISKHHHLRIRFQCVNFKGV